MNVFISALNDFFSLIFPRVCMACGINLLKHEECICTFCNYHLPKTNFHLEQDNPVTLLFRGRSPVHSAASLYFFSKGGKVQHMIHQLKYRGQKEIGQYLGKHYGKELLKSPLFNTADVIIPVPLHYKKLRKRGYNQSEYFARGLAESMNISIDVKTLVKTTKTESQTKKTKFKRWENVKEVFNITHSEHLINKHVLLVDDVITTGATLESCMLHLSKIPGIKISIASLACIHH
jgi:ComF family protein